MSLLDTFTLLFESDAGEAADDVGSLNDKLSDTEKAADGATNSVDGTTQATGELSGGLLDAAKSAATFIGSFMAFSAIKDLMLETASATDELGKLAQTFDFNITKLDAWGAAAERNGGSAQAFNSQVVGLKGQLSQIQFGGGTEIVQTLGMMGISAYNSNGQLKDTLSILEDVSSAMESMDTRTSAAFGSRLGFDQGTILLLQQGRYNLQQLVEQQTQFGSATDKAYVAAADFDDMLDNLDRSFSSIWQSVNAAVLPAFTWIGNKLNDVITFFRENEEFATGFFVAVGAAISYYALPPLITLAGTIWAVIAPFVAVGAAAVAAGAVIGLVFDDVANYINGNDSLIGRLADKYEWFGDIVEFVISRVKEEWDRMQAIFDWLILLIKSPQEAISELKNELLSIGDAIKNGFKNGTEEAVEWVKNKFTELWEWIKGLFDFSFITDGLKESIGSVKDFFTFGSEDKSIIDITADEASETFSSFKSWFSSLDMTPDFGLMNKSMAMNTQAAMAIPAMYNSNPLNNFNSQTLNNSNRVVNDNRQFSFRNDISAQGVTPEQVSQTFNDQFTGQINRAVSYNNDGIDY